jgi:hypothetical protein
MADKTRYIFGSDVADDEELRDSQGRLIDDDYVVGAIDYVHQSLPVPAPVVVRVR